MKNYRPEWLFDESVQTGVDYTDKELVAEYDKQHESFRNYAEEARKIASILGLSQYSSILDIGCGTGGLTIHLAGICRHVYAVDVSAAMISVLDEKIKKQGLINVSIVHSGFLTYQHKGESLDGIVANINLHHLPDFWKQIALCRFFDLLKSGGRLFLADVVFGFEPRDYKKAINNWLADLRDIAGNQMAEETVVHVRDEFSTFEWILSGMIERAGFKIDKDIEINPNIRAYVCSK
jgi:ubiquinone/menaquinone biosynthesis C-methylase UbiE